MTEYIERSIASKIYESHNYFPVIVICGPRQSGKTSLSRHLYPDYTYVNLEDITQRAAAMADPTQYLESLGNKSIIDEVQNVPELLSMIQVRVDENSDCRYILTGSSNFALMKNVSQSLAGRAATFTLLPFSLLEVKHLIESESIDSILQSGLYPGVIVNRIPSTLFNRNYYNTYVERDLRDLLKVKNILAFDTFMRMLASRIGSEFNASTIAREVGVSSVTISEWMSILTTSYIAFPLRPYFMNVGKRFTKMPKIYFYDTGLVCYLLGIESAEQLTKHHLSGALFENLAIVELIKGEYNSGKDANVYFYREKTGLEVDVVKIEGLQTSFYEIKSSQTYKADYSRNLREVVASFDNVKTATVIYNGQSIPPIAINIRDL